MKPALINLINKEIDRGFNLFEKSTFKSNFPAPAYWRHEQRTKTFITIALAKASSGRILQEPGLIRTSNSSSNNRSDYYIEIQEKSYLIEVKQVWTPVSRIKDANFFLEFSTRNLLAQIQDIKESTWNQDASIGLCISPVFKKHSDFKNKREIYKAIKSIIEQAKQKKEVLSISFHRSTLFSGVGVHCEKGLEYYLGYFIIWVK